MTDVLFYRVAFFNASSARVFRADVLVYFCKRCLRNNGDVIFARNCRGDFLNGYENYCGVGDGEADYYLWRVVKFFAIGTYLEILFFEYFGKERKLKKHNLVFENFFRVW